MMPPIKFIEKGIPMPLCSATNTIKNHSQLVTHTHTNKKSYIENIILNKEKALESKLDSAYS